MQVLDKPAKAAKGDGSGNDPSRRESKGMKGWLRVLAWPLVALGLFGAQNGGADADKRIGEKVRNKDGGADEAEQRIVQKKKAELAAQNVDAVANLREPANAGFPSMPRCSDFNAAIASHEASEANFDPELHAKLIEELGPMEKVLAITVKL